MAADGNDFTNLVVNGKIEGNQDWRLALDRMTLKIGCGVERFVEGWGRWVLILY
jgi:hypothetical protein